MMPDGDHPVPADPAPAAGPEAGATRASRRVRSRRGASTVRRRRRTVIGALVLIVLLVLGIGWRKGLFFGPADYEGSGTGSVSVVVEEGQTGSQIAQRLADAGVVASSGAFVEALRSNPGSELQPGTYTLREHMAAAEALTLMRSGGRTTNRVTVREGMWQSEVFQTLSAATGTPVAEYQKAVAAARKNPEVLGLPSSAKGNAEGYLFPATYQFDPGTSATVQLKTMVSHAKAELDRLGVPADEAEKIMIIASLVEAEAKADADRPKVARVIYNRLALPMRLQLDSTVSYGVQKRAVTTSDAERAATNPYNTYVRDGLPAGPVDNPGAASIEAARNPAAGTWLFFVTVNPETGETVFSDTKEQHDKAVLQFQAWCQAHPGTC